MDRVVSTHTVLSERVFSAMRSPQVADAASVSSATWSSTTVPRVFSGIAGYLGGRNRGRLPFVEFSIASQDFAHATLEGGTVTSSVIIRAHCGGRDPETATNLLRAILTAGLAAVRDEAADNYTALGDDRLGDTELGPWGHMQDASLTVEHTFARDDYEVT